MTGNRWFMQMIADLFGVRVATIGLEEVSALGAAYIAGLEAGIFKDIDQLATLRDTMRYFDPNPASNQLPENNTVRKSMVNKHC